MGSSILWILKKDGKDYNRKGKVLLAESAKVLKFSDFNSNAGEQDIKSNYAIVKYQLLPLNEGEIKLQVTDDCTNSEKTHKESQQFWNNVLPKLKQVLRLADNPGKG